MAALSEKNLEDFEKQKTNQLRASRRASIVSRRSSVAGSTSGVPMGRRLSRALGGAHRDREGAPGMKSAVSSSTALSHAKPRVRYENTYKMEPEPDAKFMPGRCGEILQQILDANLHNARYETQTVGILTRKISEDIKARVKDMKIPRYKIVSQVFIGSKSGQSMEISSRTVWDAKTDNFASRSFENDSIFAIATVHCTYFE